MKIKLTIALIILLVGSTILSILTNETWYGITASAISIFLSICSIWIPTTKEVFFKVQDWEVNETCSKLIICETQHKLGNKITCEIFESHQLYGYEQVYGNVYTNSGNITIVIGKGCEFNGKVLVKG